MREGLSSDDGSGNCEGEVADMAVRRWLSAYAKVSRSSEVRLSWDLLLPLQNWKNACSGQWHGSTGGRVVLNNIAIQEQDSQPVVHNSSF